VVPSLAVKAAIGACMLAIAVAPASVSADDAPSKQQCREAYENGQRVRRTGKLIEARRDFLLCARDPCPLAFQPECVQWLDEVERLQPTVVIDVRGPTDGVRVLVDGSALASALDGREIPIDPGDHAFRVETPGHAPTERHELIVEGTKATKLVFTPARSVALAADVLPSRSLASPVVFTALTAAAGALWAVAGFTGLSEYNGCSASCPAATVNDINTRWVLTDVAAPVTIALVGVAVFFWVRWATSKGPRQRVLAWTF
jgi:hypothetical protein